MDVVCLCVCVCVCVCYEYVYLGVNDCVPALHFCVPQLFFIENCIVGWTSIL